MKRIVYWLLSTVTVVVLLFGYRTSLAGPLARQGKTVASSPPPAAASGSTTAGTASRTVTGPVVQTQWGPVQVQVKVNGGKLADVSVLQSPNGNPRDQESLDAQSANIDMVSGATVTSDGYLQSLQGALDKAGL